MNYEDGPAEVIGAGSAEGGTSFMCEEAKSGRSSCKDTSCKKPIDKGAWRIMKLSKVGDKTFSAPYHPECLMNSMRRARWRMTSVEEIPGIESVPEDEKASWQAALDRVHAEMKEAKENPKPKAKKAPKKKVKAEEGEGDDSGAAAAAGAGAEEEPKPKKAAAGGKRKASAALDAEAAAGEEAEPAASKETKKKAAPASKKPAKKRARKSKRDESDYDSAEDDE